MSKYFHASVPRRVKSSEDMPHGPHLGGGSYGTVYEHPTDPQMVRKFWTPDDRAYTEYLNEIMLSDQIRARMGFKHNPHFPRIFDVYEPSGKHDPLLIVDMERLEESNEDEIYKGPFLKDLRRSVQRWDGPVLDEAFERLYPRKWDDMTEVSFRIVRVLHNNRACADLCGQNIMQRESDGLFVVTDPVCS